MSAAKKYKLHAKKEGKIIKEPLVQHCVLVVLLHQHAKKKKVKESRAATRAAFRAGDIGMAFVLPRPIDNVGCRPHT